jgi:hypothetical protein
MARVSRTPALVPAARAVPGLARIAGSAWLHTTEWGVRTSVRTGLRVARAVVSPTEMAALAREAADVVGVASELARAVVAGVPVATALSSAGESLAEPPVVSVTERASSPEALRRRGAELLERSRDVWSNEQGHPAYGRILDEVAPDEARILLLLLQGGPQPSVDVRTGGPIGLVSSELIAPGLTMIGSRAGVRYHDHVPAYLNNLFRLGLVWFSKEALRDPGEYQVLEAQPDVLAALHSVKFAKVVRRSIHLTPFGEDFCRTCLVEEAEADQDYPEHQAPDAGEASEPPSP